MLRVVIVLGALLYLGLVKWAYIVLVAPYFTYMGFAFHPLPVPWELLTSAIALAPALWLPNAIVRPSQAACWLMFLTVYLPSNVIPYYALDLSPLEILPLSAALLAGFGILGAAYRWPLMAIDPGRMKPSGYAGILVLGALALNAILVASFGIRTSLPGFMDVYDTRFEFRDTLSDTSMSKQIAYALNWLGHVVNPLLILLGLQRRHLGWLAFGVLGQIYIYSLTGLKGILLSGVFVLVLFIFMRGHGKRLGFWMLGGSLGMLAVVCLYDLTAGGYTLSSLFFRRMIVAPGLLTGAYYEFFSENSKALLAHSVFAPFIEYPYAVTPPYLIGDWFFHNPAVNANANIWADAYANFGLFGIVLFSAILAWFFNLYDSLSRHLDLRFAAVFIGIGAFSLTNSALLPALLTHGLLLALVFVALMPPEASRRPGDEEAPPDAAEEDPLPLAQPDALPEIAVRRDVA